MFKDLTSQIRIVYDKVKLGYSLVNQIATDNSKVTRYLPPAVYNFPPAVYDQLMAFKAKRGLQSVEMAVTVILLEYFGLSQAPVVKETDTTSRLETLEANCTSLSETVAELRAAIATLQSSSSPLLSESETPADQSEPLPLLDAQANAPLDNSLVVDQSQPLSPTAANASESGAIDELTESSQLRPLDVESGELVIPEPLNQPFSTPMTQAALARRLGVNTSTISRMQSKPNFSEWSQQKDPEGIAWVKSPETKLFYPQTQIGPE